jgi:molecular chaperone DnaK
MLKDQITKNIDTSIDPMTVVAKGAALFASTISVSDEIIEITRDKTKLQLEINYEATTVELDSILNIRVLKEKTTGIFPEEISADIVKLGGGISWSSGKKQINSKRAILIDGILLEEQTSNSFEILTYDGQGNKLECQPSRINILQGVDGLDKMQVLPYHIGIGKFFYNEDKDLFMPIKGLEKNKPIKTGIVGVINGLKTRKEIRPGMAKDIIRIPIYQGSYNADGTNPVLNNLINEVIITGESLPGLLPVNSDVDITIKVDSSQLMKFSAYFPLLDYTEELKIDIKKTIPLTAQKLTHELQKAKQNAEKVNENDIAKRISFFEDKLKKEKGSPDGRMKILDGLRKELLKLDSFEKLAEWPKIEKELKDIFYNFENLVEEIKDNNDSDKVNMDTIMSYILEYKNKIEQIIKEKNTKEAKNLIREIDQLDFDIRNAVTDNAMDVNFLHQVNNNFDTYNWKDANKARQLINQGLHLVTGGETSAIRPILIKLIALMPDNEKPKETLG